MDKENTQQHVATQDKNMNTLRHAIKAFGMLLNVTPPATTESRQRLQESLRRLRAQSDNECLWHDFAAVGDDIRKAMHSYGQK